MWKNVLVVVLNSNTPTNEAVLHGKVGTFRLKKTYTGYFFPQSCSSPFSPPRGMSIYSLIVVQAVSLSATLRFCEGREHFLKIFGSTHHSLWVQNLRISLPWHPPSGCLFSPFILALLAVPYFLIYMLPSK